MSGLYIIGLSNGLRMLSYVELLGALTFLRMIIHEMDLGTLPCHHCNMFDYQEYFSIFMVFSF